MRITTSKFSFFTYLSTTILLVTGVLLFGCTTSSLGSNQGNASKIRQPEGSSEAFWDALEWTMLTPAEQTLWKKLGWNKASWQGKTEEPVSESKTWGELTNEERIAAKQLGYDEQSWNTLLQVSEIGEQLVRRLWSDMKKESIGVN